MGQADIGGGGLEHSRGFAEQSRIEERVWIN